MSNRPKERKRLKRVKASLPSQTDALFRNLNNNMTTEGTVNLENQGSPQSTLFTPIKNPQHTEEVTGSSELTKESAVKLASQ